MTISAVVPDIAFTGSGGAGTMGPFSLVKNGTAIVYYNNSDIYVYRYSSVTDETPELLVEGVDYTLTGSPGSITLTSPQTGLLTAERLYVMRKQTLAQALDLTNGGSFSSSSLERRLDIIEAKFQEQARDIKSAVRFAMFDTDEIPGTVPLARAIDRLPYISGTASNPILEFINVNELGATANLTESQLADIAVVVADLTGADTIGLVAEAFDTIGVEALQDVAENIGEVELVADALADGGLSVTKDTYAALTAIPAASRSNDMVVYVAGRAAVGDGGQGYWRFSSVSVATADGGTILAPDAGTGRWLRIYSDTLLLEQFGAVGDGATNDNTAITAAMTAASTAGVILSGIPGKVYAVTGQVTVPGPLRFQDAHLKQLAPASSTSLRTLLSSGHSGHRWARITVDINGDGSYGSIEDYRGISIASGSDMILEDLEVFGNNLLSAIVLNACEDVRLVRPWVHDIAFDLASDPGDDRINGIRVIGGKNVSIIDPIVEDLTGDYGSGSLRRYTRGIIGSGGTVGFNVLFGRIENVDQGVDLTGSDGVLGFLILGLKVKKPNSWGIKVANSPKRGKVSGCCVEEAGYGAYVVSGLADESNRPERVLFEGNLASGMDSTSTNAAQTDRFFYGVLDGGAAGNGIPRFINFRDNYGEVPSGGTAPNYEFYTDFAANTTNGGVLWSGGQTSGASTSKFGGNAGYMRADVTLTANQSVTDNNETKITFDSETYDPMGLHDGTGIFTAPRDGLYGYNCIAVWDNNATGTRRLILRKNSTNEVGEDRQQGENSAVGQSQSLSGMIYLDAGDTISFRGIQTSGGALNVVAAASRASFWLISN